MKKIIIPLTVVVLLSGCATTLDTAKSVTSKVADTGKSVAAKTVDAGKAVTQKAESSNQKPDMMAMLTHTNPVPNYMQVVVKHGEDLNLSADQSSQLAKWREKAHEKSHGLVKQIIESEKALYQASMENKSRAEISEMAQSIMEKRLAIIDGKTRGRDNMKRILDDKQWAKVINIYKDMN